MRLLLAIALVVVACRKQDADSTTPIEMARERITDADATIELKISYRALPQREIELIAALSAVGIVETEKLVVDVLVDGFVLVGGEPQWSGFVAPRQPIKHRTSFRLLDGNDSSALTLSVHRSRNSEVLFERRIEFASDGERVKAIAGDVDTAE